MNDLDESAIGRGLRQGDASAWRRFYDAHADRLWRAAARLVGPSSSDVADVVQETFLAAARSAGGYDATRGTLWNWLWGIARNQIALHYRKQERQHRLQQAADARARNASLDGRGSGAQPDAALLAAEQSLLVRATLAALPLEYETLLTAHYLEGVSVEALAESQRKSAAAVRSQLARARQAFRVALGQGNSPFGTAQARGAHESA